jgi:hypothetical protein
LSIKPRYLKTSSICIAALLALVSLGVIGSSSRAQDFAWSQPIVVSPKERSHWFPEVVADLEGKVHLFWVTGRPVENGEYPGYDTVMYCKIENGGCNEHFEIVAYGIKGGSNVTRPAAVVDDRNMIHLLSRGIAEQGGITVIYYRRAPANMAHSPWAWSSPQVVSGLDNSAAYSDIIVDQENTIHVVWSELTPLLGKNVKRTCVGCSDILYRRSTNYGATWGPLLNLSESKMGAEKPQLVSNGQGGLFLFWEEGSDFYANRGAPVSSGFVSSMDGGVSWLPATMFAFPNDAPQRITGGLDGQGKLVVVWGLVKSKEIYYQISSDRGRSWTFPRAIPGVLARSLLDIQINELDDYHMAADSAGHLHLVLVGTSPNDQGNNPPTSVYHIEWNGTNWSAPEVIYTDDNDLPEWPRIAVARGNELHLVWFVRDAEHVYDSDNARYQIWYAHKLTSAPVISPVIPTPTLAPQIQNQASVTPTVTPTPTPVSFLNAFPVSVEATRSIYTDTDEIMVVIWSLLPPIGLVALIIFVVRFWRRF